ncbi:amidohydrolase [Kibdelosporangium persicum]|uniref:Exoenzymes regulatory protein AepA in lipid-linked oligosaccharide synthesis cluster n=1 Tax=Kibdelosporangium persicum TaxID=2698649 RepID=A0ABX2FFP8_9PSEU|nr:amidohydrolase [Kibdelosporangium persicum]NRN70197.1 Exoenzymes regulatory protein AepA in lipid-linked oligosaccharide synthesis cluster [Kibdelosporangium persicum]
MAADLILTNAVVYTMDPARPWAASLAVTDGKIVDDTGRGPNTEIIDLDGAFVLPGLVDVHNHHAMAGRAELFELTFAVDASFEDILDAVRARARDLGPDEWLVGGAWASTLVETLSRSSARHALDEAAGGRPVALADDSRHNRWVSSRALELAGITAATPDPPGGVISRDDGEPSGLLLEAAGVAVERAAGGLTADQHRRASRRAIEILHAHGVTAFQDAGVSADILGALKSLDDAGELNAWVVSSLLVNDPIFGYDPIGAPLLELAGRYRTEHHRPDFVKIFLDGVPPTRTAAFLEPYLPDEVHGTCFHGATTMSGEELTGWLRTAAKAGFSAKVHCTGDASVRLLLDAVSTIRAEGYTETRFHVAHGQFVHPDDLPRFAELGVAADISPFLWVPGVIPEAIAGVLPAERAARMQPNRALLDSGALVAGGSDWPVSESPNAWEGIAGLVTRQDPYGRRPGALWPAQAITLAEAIEVFTLGGARACGLDDVTGALTPGRSADFVVLDRNPFRTADVAGTQAVETWFAGRRVFQR